MKGNVRNFFPSGNTSLGFYSFYDYIINQESAIKKVCITGVPGTRKSSLMKNIGALFNDKGYDIEYHHCSFDNDSLDGIVIKGLDVAILDSTVPHIVNYKTPGAVDEFFNMGIHWNEEDFKKYREGVLQTNKEMDERFQRAYKFIGAAKLIHDNWTNYNKCALDYLKLSTLEEDLKCKILSNYQLSCLGKERHLFATAFTSNGIITYIDNLHEDCEKTFVLNGGPGTGKTQILKFILAEALKRGFNIEVYHDPLIPSRIEHIVILDLKIALITSNEINAQKFNGIQIFMDNLINYDLIDRTELQEDKENFYSLLNKGLSIISSAKKIHNDLEKYSIDSMHFEELDENYKTLLTKLLKYEKSYKDEKRLPDN